jgi:hypothetical protein
MGLANVGFPIGCLMGYIVPALYFDVNTSIPEQRESFEAYLLF